MKKYFIICVFAFSQVIGGTAVKADSLPNLVGTYYSKYPDNTCKNYEGYISTQNESYLITSALCKKNYVIWLSKRINNKEDDKNSNNLVLLDQINVRTLKKGESFSSGPYCYENDKSIEWAAVYNWNGKNKATKKNSGIINAWVVNFNTEKFELAPIKLLDSVYCTTDEE